MVHKVDYAVRDRYVLPQIVKRFKKFQEKYEINCSIVINLYQFIFKYLSLYKIKGGENYDRYIGHD